MGSIAQATAKLVEIRPIQGSLKGESSVWEIPNVGRYSMFWDSRYQAYGYTLWLKTGRTWNAAESGGLPTDEAVHEYAARRLPELRRARSNATRRWMNRARKEEMA